MSLKYFLFFLIIINSFQFYSQEEEKLESTKEAKSKFDLGLEGMLGLSIGPDLYALNVGGPSFKVRINNDLKIGIGALPSLYLYKNELRASLGVSPNIYYKNFVLIAPFYNLRDPESLDGSYIFVWSIGLGYKF